MRGSISVRLFSRQVGNAGFAAGYPTQIPVYLLFERFPNQCCLIRLIIDQQNDWLIGHSSIGTFRSAQLRGTEPLADRKRIMHFLDAAAIP